ncbi:amidohydrolase family protein [Blastococcus sp. TML/C7B]|nr:amidohydrolase family protein [Blastococcus sp. TML/C7B]MBN1097928.1 amidohydrolase family protein [Blastococcus sp. TML/C7B]
MTAATSTPAEVFGLDDRGRLVAGGRADLVLLDGDPTADITATQRLRRVWVLGREAELEAYAGSPAEREGITWLNDSTAKIVQAIQDSWPGIPAPEDVRREEDGELLGRVVPTSGGWQAVTTFGAALGTVSSYDDALDIVRTLGMSCLAEPWWARPLDQREWREVPAHGDPPRPCPPALDRSDGRPTTIRPVVRPRRPGPDPQAAR